MRWLRSHAPRERVSWNKEIEDEVEKAISHAPRERVSWNYFWTHFFTPFNRVTLHVSVWVEITYKRCLNSAVFVTLHVSVWVEIWKRVLNRYCYLVTLHVSVWVEISKVCLDHMEELVTLHVSVWVEMTIWKNWQIFSRHAPRERVSWNF